MGSREWGTDGAAASPLTRRPFVLGLLLESPELRAIERDEVPSRDGERGCANVARLRYSVRQGFGHRVTGTRGDDADGEGLRARGVRASHEAVKHLRERAVSPHAHHSPVRVEVEGARDLHRLASQRGDAHLDDDAASAQRRQHGRDVPFVGGDAPSFPRGRVHQHQEPARLGRLGDGVGGDGP